MACDTCNKVTDSLNTLDKFYRTENIVMVCDKCLEIIDKRHRREFKIVREKDIANHVIARENVNKFIRELKVENT